MSDISDISGIFGIFWYFLVFLVFVRTIHTNFHAKSGVCSSKNERVMALGTKEDGHLYIILYSQAIIQSKLGVREFARLDNKPPVPKKWDF